MTITFRTGGRGVLALAVVAILAHDVRSDDVKAPSRPSPFDGAWKQVGQRNGDAKEYQEINGGEFLNLVTGGRFVWTVIRDGKLLASAGGRCKVEGGKYLETIEFVHGDGVPASFVGSTFEFTGEAEGDKWHKVGTIQVNGQDYKIDEKWERCK